MLDALADLLRAHQGQLKPTGVPTVVILLVLGVMAAGGIVAAMGSPAKPGR